MRTIVQSRTYQTASVPNESNQNDRTNYSWMPPRPLDAEVLLDAICQVLDLPGEFEKAMGERRTVNLPQPDLQNTRFLEVYGRADRMVVPDRKNEANLGQALHMLAGETFTEKLA